MQIYEVVIERRDYHRIVVEAYDYQGASVMANNAIKEGDWGRKIESQVSIAFIEELNQQGETE